MELEQDILKKSREAREINYESKEGETDPELQAGASMERADYLVKEVKSSKQQMQNIALHIQQVKQAIKQIRAELQLQSTGNATSTDQDQERLNNLKKQIIDYQDELIKMKDDLVKEQIEELKNNTANILSEDQLKQKAEQMVDQLINSA